MVWSSANVVSIWDMFGEELIVLVGLVVGGSVVCCNRPQRSALQDEGGCLVDAWRLTRDTVCRVITTLQLH